MLNRFIVLCGAMLLASVLPGQYVSHVCLPDSTTITTADAGNPGYKWARTITAEDLRSHLQVLASDKYEGRETGTVGNDLAAAYIAQHFKELGFPPLPSTGNYYQEISFNRTGWSENEIVINDNQYRHLWDYLAYARQNSEMKDFRPEEVVFLGFGIDDQKYSDYKGRDVRGKVIMINKGEPFDRDSVSYITGTSVASEWDGNVWKKLETAQQHGVALVLIIENEIKSFLNKNRRFLVSSSLQLGNGELEDKDYADHIYISSTMARDLIGKKDGAIKKWRKKNTKKAKTKAIELDPELYINMRKNVEVIRGHNVLGYIEGDTKKDELVVVSAHYDHLGKRGNDIFNGADDNGSGTVTLMEMAEAIAQAKDAGQGPERSILFLLVTGEEKGLLGSKYYAENPVFPLDQTIVDVNVDMIGRVDQKYQDNPKYIYVIGSDRLSSELHRLNEEVNNRFSDLTLDYRYNDVNDPNRYYFRSDHYNFARKGIPSIFFFSGTHEDYHRPSDTPDKIMYDKMETVGRHIFMLTWELANREKAIKVDRTPEIED